MSDAMTRLATAIADRYRVERVLGTGGMATVYLAQDLRHDRHVGLKVLRPELAAIIGAERFLSEIKTTANLQHPHILPLHDSGEVDGTVYYVMPFVEGESLRDRLTREKQLPVDEAVRITIEVADALQYAHAHGVIHRDIKPENILLHGGHALVADFGIALAASTTAGDRMTETGMSLGTPTYMSPEQAMGERTLDARTDIYALGCVLYEMLTGDPPFTGSTAQAVVAKVLTSDPVPVTATRRTVPAAVDAAVLAALEKLPADRPASAAAFVAALKGEAPTAGGVRRAAATAGRSRLGIAIFVVAAAATGLLLGRAWPAKAGAPPGTERHWNLLLPTAAPLALTGPGPQGFWQPALAISPAGDRLAYVTAQAGTTMLAVRPLDRDTAVVLGATEGAYHPFFSPDGRWIGYFTGNELRKILVDGGTPITITTVDRPSGATWATPEEILLLQQDGFQLRRIAASGGRDSSLLLNSQFGALSVLPGGEWVVGHISSGQLAMLSLANGSMEAITPRGVIPVDSVRQEDLVYSVSPRYVTSGHLVFASRDGTLMALPFDGASRKVLGPPVPVVDGVRIEEGFGYAQYGIGPDGTLIFVPGQSQLFSRIALTGPGGRLDTLPMPRAQYTQPRVSPDGTRLAVNVRKPVGGWEIQVLDLRSGAVERIEVPGNYRAYPGSWMPDGRALIVGVFHPVRNVFIGARLYSFAQRSWENLGNFSGSYLSVMPDGQRLVYSDFRTGALYLRALRGDTTSIPVPGRGWGASFSPDGRWLAWGDAEGGIAASPVPPTGEIIPLTKRGQQPTWSADGRRLTYRDGRRFFELTVDPTQKLRGGVPRLVAEGPFVRTFAWNHAQMPDGRLVMLVALPGAESRELKVITGFGDALRRLAPPTGDR